MNYLLSEQDLKEILWEVEDLAYRLRGRIADKFVNECPHENEDSVEEEEA